MADRVLVLTVPGNHDEARRDWITTAGDPWAIEAVASTADALELSGQYKHVTFIYPEPDDLHVTPTHGHVIGSPNKMPQWQASQALGTQCVREANILSSGHFHTGSHQDLGGGRSWLMAPRTGQRIAVVPEPKGR